MEACIYSFIMVVILFTLALLFIIRFYKKTINNVNRALQHILNNTLNHFEKEYQKTLPKQTFDLIHKLKSYLIDKEHDILKIVENEEDIHFTQMEDSLSQAILKLHGSIKEQKEQELIRKKEEENFNWATKGEAIFGEILRSSEANIGDLSFNLIKSLADYVSAVQGGIFVLNSSDKENQTFDLMAAIAYDRRKLLENRITIGEGLIGRCAFEKLTIYIEDVPKDYVNITSGLGQANPRSILLIPAKVEGKVYAVIELISFNKFEPYQIDFIERIGESIGSTLRNAMINENTKHLLEQSKAQSEEMAAQEEELRQNLEELQATQEEVNRLRKEEESRNHEMFKEVESYKTTLTKILDQIPDKIFLKDKDCRMLIVNQAVLKAHNVQVEELLGKNDFDFIEDHAEAQKYFDEEQNIIVSGKPMKVLQKEVINDTGVYLDSIKIPFFIDYLNQTGILGIQHDITTIVKLEEELNTLREAYEELKIKQQ